MQMTNALAYNNDDTYTHSKHLSCRTGIIFVFVFFFRNVGAASAAMHKPAVSLADSTDLR